MTNASRYESIARGFAKPRPGRMMGHSRSTLVDQVYAHSLQSGMASVAERVTARALGEQPKLRVIEGGQPAGSAADSPRDIRERLEDSLPQQENKQATG